MDFRVQIQKNYDAIVVGSGLGGISAAALLAKAHRKVLVIESHDRPGGYARSFERNGYHFDTAVHMTGGCEPKDSPMASLIDKVLRVLNVRDKCIFLKLDTFYSALFSPDMKIDIPLGINEFINTHIKYFPEEENGIRQLMRISSQIRIESRNIPDSLSSLSMIDMQRLFPTLLKYSKATVKEVLDQYLNDFRLKAVLTAFWPFVGLPPSRLSFVYWSIMLTSILEDGAYYCKGTFQNLVNAFVYALKHDGGDLLLRNKVKRIIVKNNNVEGVILESGFQINSPVVISNSDAIQTFQELVGLENLPNEFVNKLFNMKPSLSAFVVYMATSLSLDKMGAKHEMLVYRTFDHDKTFAAICNGELANMMINIPTLRDPLLAPNGQHLITITTLIPHKIASSWTQQKERYAELLIDELEKLFPGLRDHITFAEGAIPQTMERFSLNLTGPMYGWEVSPEQVGSNRLPNKTPINGLYLSGHWAQPGGGTYTVIVSGIQTAQQVLGYDSIGKFLNEITIKK